MWILLQSCFRAAGLGNKDGECFRAAAFGYKDGGRRQAQVLGRVPPHPSADKWKVVESIWIDVFLPHPVEALLQQPLCLGRLALEVRRYLSCQWPFHVRIHLQRSFFWQNLMSLPNPSTHLRTCTRLQVGSAPGRTAELRSYMLGARCASRLGCWLSFPRSVAYRRDMCNAKTHIKIHVYF